MQQDPCKDPFHWTALGNETLAGGECLDKIEKTLKYFVQRFGAEKPDREKTQQRFRRSLHSLGKIVQPPIVLGPRIVSIGLLRLAL